MQYYVMLMFVLFLSFVKLISPVNIFDMFRPNDVF